MIKSLRYYLIAKRLQEVKCDLMLAGVHLEQLSANAQVLHK